MNEFEFIDRLATILGISGPEAQEERNTDAVYKRTVLRKALAAIEQKFPENNDNNDLFESNEEHY